MNVLLIGNSYTYYNEMPALFEALCRTNGRDTTVSAVTKGGRKLIAYKDREDPITIQLEEAIRDQVFDVCFLQEQSVLPAIDFDTFFEGANFVFQKVKNHAKSFVMYATWGRKEGSETLEKYKWSTESMTRFLSEAYQKVAEHIGARISPAGLNFLKVTKTHPEINLHNADLSHPSYYGSCLSALTHYHTLFGEFPKNTECLELPAEVLEAFLDAVL